MQMLKKRKKSQHNAFTLAELMVVIVIVGLLVTLVVPNLIRNLFTAKRGIAEAQIRNLAGAVESYMYENGRFPETLELLVQPDENGMTLLKDATELPLDPWSNEFFYEVDSNGMSFELGSYGADGQPGGEGDNEDITNKTMANRRNKQDQ